MLLKQQLVETLLRAQAYDLYQNGGDLDLNTLRTISQGIDKWATDSDFAMLNKREVRVAAFKLNKSASKPLELELEFHRHTRQTYILFLALEINETAKPNST